MFPSLGTKWRSSVSFATLVVGLGIACDLLVYSIVIPVLPFRLEHLGYEKPSALTGWLIFAYSGGLVASTLPIAMFSERYSVRRLPMIGGLVALLGSQVLLMEAPAYWVMCIARILQGVSSSVVWVVGLAMLCDTAPEKHVGRQLGIAIMGLSIGLVTGPPVGGVLYGRFGFRAPFIFSIGVTLVDLTLRVLFVERKEALRYGIDPAALPEDDPERAGASSDRPVGEDRGVVGDSEKPPQEESEKPPQEESEKPRKSESEKSPQLDASTLISEKGAPSGSHVADIPHATPQSSLDGPVATGEPIVVTRPPTRSLVEVMVILSKSSRALSSMIIVFVYGAVYTAQEPTLPLRLQSAFGLDTTQVGLTFLAAIVPTLFASPVTGWCTDRHGAEWVTFLCLLISLPWWAIVVVRSHFGLFVFAFAIECFFTSGVVSPVTAELAAVSRTIEGVGYAHVYGAFNIAYGIGTAVGPLMGGQIYARARYGWVTLCLVSVGILIISMVLSFLYIGADPLFDRVVRGHRSRNSEPHDITTCEIVTPPSVTVQHP